MSFTSFTARLFFFTLLYFTLSLPVNAFLFSTKLITLSCTFNFSNLRLFLLSSLRKVSSSFFSLCKVSERNNSSSFSLRKVSARNNCKVATSRPAISFFFLSNSASNNTARLTARLASPTLSLFAYCSVFFLINFSCSISSILPSLIILSSLSFLLIPARCFLFGPTLPGSPLPSATLILLHASKKALTLPVAAAGGSSSTIPSRPL